MSARAARKQLNSLTAYEPVKDEEARRLALQQQALKARRAATKKVLQAESCSIAAADVTGLLNAVRCGHTAVQYTLCSDPGVSSLAAPGRDFVMTLAALPLQCELRVQSKKLSAEELKKRNREFYAATATADEDTLQLMQSILAADAKAAKR